MKLLSNCYKTRRIMKAYLDSRQLESDLEIIERQLARLTQEVRMVDTQLQTLIEVIKAARASRKP